MVEAVSHRGRASRSHHPLEHQLEHFCAVIRGEAQPLVTARDGLQNLRVTEAIALAARTGQPVSIEVRQ